MLFVTYMYIVFSPEFSLQKFSLIKRRKPSKKHKLGNSLSCFSLAAPKNFFVVKRSGIRRHWPHGIFSSWRITDRYFDVLVTDQKVICGHQSAAGVVLIGELDVRVTFWRAVAIGGDSNGGDFPVLQE